MADKPKRPRGRPSTFDPLLLPEITRRCEEGATNREIADFIGVAESQLWRWSQANPDLRVALKVGKEAADDRVEASLYRRATGYSFEAVKIVADAKTGAVVQVPYTEHVPPDTTAMIFWLKNRKPADWRDKRDIEHSGKLSLGQLVEQAIAEASPKPNDGGA